MLDWRRGGRCRVLFVAADPSQGVYADVVRIAAGPYDLVMDFGFRSPEEQRQDPSAFTTVARVSMSLAHAKSMLPLLAQGIAEYEQQWGEIPVPGFGDVQKS